MASRAIRSHAYDRERHELTVVFATGRTYVYGLVPEDVATAFAAAASPGAFHNRHLRDRYPVRRHSRSVTDGAGEDLRAALKRSLGD